MATIAGDEITESLVKQYLVDFATAEQLKIALSANGPFCFKDILGFEHSLDEKELRETIEPCVQNLAQVIAKKIIDCNDGKPPAAVFLVGGGSKTPGLCALVASQLNLPPNKVALAGTNFSGRILNDDAGIDGPEYATPVGIALIAADNALVESASVFVNASKVRLFSPSTASVMDALLMAGYKYTDLMGRNGRSLHFTLNGVRTVVRGTPYTTAIITLNDKEAILSSPIKNGDEINVVKAENGEDAKATIAAYAGEDMAINVSLNGTLLLAGLVAHCNGTPVPKNTSIKNNDEIQITVFKTLQELCHAAQIATDNAAITVNGKPKQANYILQNNDEIKLITKDGGSPLPIVLTASLPTKELQDALQKTEAPTLPENNLQEDYSNELTWQNAPSPTVRSLHVVLNGKNVMLPPKKDGEPYRLFDMLTLVDIDPASPKGKVQVLVNGSSVPYLETLVSGDKVEIGWEKE